MPDFYNLAKYVMDFFDPPKGSAVESEFRPWIEENESGSKRSKTPLDQIFHLLHQEYGRDEVNELVAERLWNYRVDGAKSTEHSVIARISSDQEGKPQIVTTNFDLLFEKSVNDGELEIYQPPAFPDISLGVPLTGIIYLHGRLQDPKTENHPYILSSADFGRAYLSEGWATNFIRSLLKSYTVVLIGYQAEDPPVKYLLQGLNHDGRSDRSNLYAFDKGKPEDIEAKWRDRGITPIACKDYPSLWESLTAWAERAENQRQWRANVIDTARKGPRKLFAHERGQVTHLVRTTPGARLFAMAEPSPPPEWLCVFDALCRVAKESRRYGEGAEKFDPFEEYGLDDDPPRSSELDKQSNWEHDHIFEWRRGDTNPTNAHRLGGRQIAGLESMPPRLAHLSNWLAKHIDSPIVAWWAARQQGLHPRLENIIKRELRGNHELHPEARRSWNLILEYQSDSRNFCWNSDWYEIKDRIENEGWTQSVLRDFETATAPVLFLQRPLGIGASKPPSGDWEETSTQEVARFEVKFPDRYELKLPDETLEPVLRIVESHLRRSEGLLLDVQAIYFLVPTCYPERKVDVEENDIHAMFNWYVELFVRMISYDPKKAKAYVTTWPIDESFYFRKLRLFALNHAELFGAEEVVDSLMALSQESFWDHDARRELLFLLRDRWEGFSVKSRQILAERLLDGPDESDEEYPTLSKEIACRYSRWLTLQGKELSKSQTSRLDNMLSELPRWNDGLAGSFVEESVSSVRSIGTDEAPDTVIELPVTQVVESAQAVYERDFDSDTERRPFTGLVKVNPRKALASLSHMSRRNKYPQAFWSTLISDWPDETTPRLFCVFLHRLSNLPYNAIRELRNPVGRWIQKKLTMAFQFDEALAWSTFDHLVSGLISEEGQATRSGLGEVRRGGEVIEKSRRTIEHAINGPVGQVMEGLLNTLNSLKLKQGVGIPEELKFRIEHLTSAPGEGEDHAVAVLTRQICWLHYLDPEWVKERVIPWFSFEHNLSEPAWNGYLSAAKLPPYEIGVLLKPLVLKLFPRIYQWSWAQHFSTVAAQIVVELSIFRSGKQDGLNGKEARICLRNMDEKNRQDAIFRLRLIGKREESGWSEHVIPFVNTVWPRERELRTSKLVSSWVSLLDDTDDKFPEVLSSVRKFLVPVESGNHWLHSFSRGIRGKEPLTIKYPADVLNLLDVIVPNNPKGVPYELAQILDIIENTDANLVSDRVFLRLTSLIEQT
ncbi:SIR2 family protein [Idiomarina loihiensis]|jgi:hypothetical protein|uniref:SIR2 family protein n=1 Tax=Idiomarina TaxID=135575 RepID=UPI00294AC8AB|nr:SIR2 family protein [Idiomarina sp. HP20-50]MDV6316233.1 SIR2 family protein [Idiomarina sp. HP20-50]